MLDPTFVVDVEFHPKKQKHHRFAFREAEVRPDWSTEPNGMIHAPCRARVLEFKLVASEQARFLGIRIGSDPAEIAQAGGALYNSVPNHAMVQLITDGSIQVKLSEQAKPQTLSYCLGVRHDGEEHWDDPKIYNDPDET